MRIHVIAIGRARGGPEAALFDHYAGRISLWPVALIEREVRRPTAPARRVAAEGALLSEAVPDGAFTIALDENGRQLSSRAFAGLLQRLHEEGHRDVAFLIGGAGGLAAAVRDTADTVLSFGRATWPHLVVRGLLAEQIYRAQTIVSGHPYHRD